jgi:tetratricopeptide (TPR) repeat protein
LDEDENHIWNIDATAVISSHVDIYKGRVSRILANLFSYPLDPGTSIRSQASYHVVEGIRLIEKASWEQAETELAQAIKLEEDRPLWHFLLGLTVAQRCQWEESEFHIRKAIRFAAAQASSPAWKSVPTGELLHWQHVLGDVLFFEEKWLEAEKVFREILETEPHYPGVHFSLGSVFESQHKWSEAETLYRPLAELETDAGLWHANYVRVLEKQDKWPLVEWEIKKRLGLERGPQREAEYNEKLVALGRALKAQNKVEEARQVLEKALFSKKWRDAIARSELHRLLGEIYLQQGKVHLQQSNWIEAEKQFTKAVDMFGGVILLEPLLEQYLVSVAYTYRGRALLEQQRLTEAKTDLERALVLGYDPHYLLGVVLAEQQNWSEAADHFRMALTFNPKDTEGRLRLANALWAQGFQDSAVQEIRNALAGNPNAWLFYALGKFLQAQGNLPDAKEQFLSAIKTDPNEPIFRKALESVTSEQQK